MATVSWGAWDGHLRVGCIATRDGAGALFAWYVGIDGWGYHDTQQLNYSGDITGSTSYHNDLTAGSHSVHQGSVTDYMLVATKRVTGSPGEVVTATATLSGSYLAGETPRKTQSITLANVPSKPATPTNTSVTQSGVTVNMVLPANNGSTLTQTRFRIWTALTGGTQVGTTYIASPVATSHAFTGLTAGTTYYSEVSANNAIGSSAFSTRKAFTTAALSRPNAPVVAVASAVTQTSATITGTAPAANGSTITGYQHQISSSSTFATLSTDVSIPGLVVYIGGGTANTHYYHRYRANSNNGVSDWSPTRDVLTSSTIPGIPSKPTLVSYVGGVANFSWPAPGNGGSAITAYRLQIDNTDDFASPVYNTSAAGLTRAVSGLPEGVFLYAHVLATNTNGSSVYGPTLIFEVNTGGGFLIHDSDDFVHGDFLFNNEGDWIQVN